MSPVGSYPGRFPRPTGGDRGDSPGACAPAACRAAFDVGRRVCRWGSDEGVVVLRPRNGASGRRRGRILSLWLEAASDPEAAAKLLAGVLEVVERLVLRLLVGCGADPENKGLIGSGLVVSSRPDDGPEVLPRWAVLFFVKFLEFESRSDVSGAAAMAAENPAVVVQVVINEFDDIGDKCNLAAIVALNGPFHRTLNRQCHEVSFPAPRASGPPPRPQDRVVGAP